MSTDPLAQIEEYALDCIHCGLCLPFCPTYADSGNEMLSPRGRIYVARALIQGRAQLTPRMVAGLDLCLDCRACETNCPSGVRYGLLIDRLRALPEYSRARPWLTRALLNAALRHVLPFPPRISALTAFLRLYQRSGLPSLVRGGAGRLLPPGLRVAEELLPDLRSSARVPRTPEVVPAQGERKLRVGLLSGCVVEPMLRHINRATVQALASAGCEAVTPRGQVCCGALHLHQGDLDTARRLARQNVKVFEESPLDAVVVNAAGCGSAMKEYGRLLSGDPEFASRAEALSAKVRDISQVLCELSPQGPPGELKARVAYDAPCHLQHAQKVTREPVEMLRAIGGLELVPLPESDWCCGSAGVYNILQPALADRLLDRKMQHIAATGADVIATGNAGCILQIARGARRHGLKIRVCHPVELWREACG